MRKLFFVFFILLIPFLLGACSTKGGHYKGDGYSIEFPEDWEEKDDVDMPFGSGAKIDISMTNPEGKEYISVLIAKKKTPESLDIEAVSRQMFDMTSRAQGVNLDDRGEATISGQDAYWGILSFDYLTETILVYYFLNENRLYTVMCSAPSDNFDDYVPEFEEIIEESFRFEE